MNSQAQEIKRFVKTGSYDLLYRAWEGSLIPRAQQADSEMRQALVAEVKRRENGRKPPITPTLDLPAFARAKVAPLICGLFPEAERDIVVGALQDAIVFLTPDNIEEILRQTGDPKTAWDLANLYLMSTGAKPLNRDAPQIVGLSRETTCYISLEYFSEDNRFADFLVHEAAHFLHNCRRVTIGLPATRTRKYLLNIAFNQTETFAYACEAYSRILQLGHNREMRMQLAAELEQEFTLVDRRVDVSKFRAAIAQAVIARNGWKKILDACHE